MNIGLSTKPKDKDEYRYFPTNYIGYTTRGARSPVFFDTNNALRNGKPPGTLVTGVPGTGKTFFLDTILATNTLMGKMSIVLDYKGDFLWVKKLGYELGHVDVWDVSAKNSRGLLDPFFLGQGDTEQDRKDDTIRLVTQFVEILIPQITQETKAFVSALVADLVKYHSSPTMGTLVNKLLSHENEHMRNVGMTLYDTMTTNKDSNICFARDGSKHRQVRFGAGTTVVNLSGLGTLPKTIKEARTSGSGRLALGIMFLLTDFVSAMLLDTSVKLPKMIMVDEAWSILNTEQGAAMMEKAMRLGRSKNLSFVLGTQVYDDITHLPLNDMVSTHFMFRNSTEAVTRALAALGRNASGDNSRLLNLVTSLTKGECLMRDWMEQFAPVQIHAWREEWNEAFETNPEDVKEEDEEDTEPTPV